MQPAALLKEGLLVVDFNRALTGSSGSCMDGSVQSLPEHDVVCWQSLKSPDLRLAMAGLLPVNDGAESQPLKEASQQQEVP